MNHFAVSWAGKPGQHDWLRQRYARARQSAKDSCFRLRATCALPSWLRSKSPRFDANRIRFDDGPSFTSASVLFRATAAVAGLRLLMLTGCRRNEFLTLRWEDVDLEHDEIRLRDAKTGARAVPLSPTARQVLAALPRQPDNPWVISGRGPGTRLGNLNATWGVVRNKAGLEDVRLHDLRHSYASRALSLGESLPMIGKLLGHRKDQTTSRYAHLAPDSIKASSARVADSIGADILDRRRTDTATLA